MASIDLATKAEIESLKQTKQNNLNTNSVNGFNIDTASGNWHMTVNSSVEGALPDNHAGASYNIIQDQSAHFRTQIAYQVNAAHDVSKTMPIMDVCVRASYSGQEYSEWVKLQMVPFLDDYFNEDEFSDTDYLSNIAKIFDAIPVCQVCKFGCGPSTYTNLYNSLVKKLNDDGIDTTGTNAIDGEISMPTHKFHTAIITLRLNKLVKVAQMAYDYGEVYPLSKAKIIIGDN